MVQITSEVCSEVYDIICHMEEELFDKIPKGFINIIDQGRDKSYIVNIDYSKSINDQNIQRATRVVLSLIYRDYLCTEEERNLLKNQDAEELKRIDEELREKYNSNNLFKNKQIEKQEQREDLQIIEYKKINFWTKLINGIRRFFKKN